MSKQEAAQKLPKYPPYIHSGVNQRSLVFDVLLASLPLLGMAVFFFGWRVLLIAVLSVVSSVLTEAIACSILRKRRTIGDMTAAITGLFVAMMCPPSVPYLLPVVGSIFAILVVKFPFGGRGRNIFNPAAAGICFLILSAPGMMLTYPAVTVDKIPLEYSPVIETAPSLTHLLKSGGLLPADAFELLVNRFAGPTGNSFAIVLAACGLFLIVRRVLPLQTVLGYLLSAALIAFIFPRGDFRMLTVIMELCSGSLLYCAVFFCADPSSTAKTGLGRLFFGVCAGVTTMMFRYSGVFEQGAPFAILLCNACVPIFDRIAWQFSKKLRVNGIINQ